MPVIRAHVDNDSPFHVRIQIGRPAPIMVTRKADGATVEVGTIHRSDSGRVGVRFHPDITPIGYEALREIALAAEMYENVSNLVDALSGDGEG